MLVHTHLQSLTFSQPGWEIYCRKNSPASANVSYSNSLLHTGTFSLCGLYCPLLRIVLKVITQDIFSHQHDCLLILSFIQIFPVRTKEGEWEKPPRKLPELTLKWHFKLTFSLQLICKWDITLRDKC